ncbi:MAG: hypothetical protein ABEL76_05925 [Bradymonadaceae bacterium]
MKPGIRPVLVGLVPVLLLPGLSRAGESNGTDGSGDHSDPTGRPAFAITVGPTAGVRTMKLTGDADRIRTGPGPYLGVRSAADIQLARFDAVDGALHLDGEVVYAVARGLRPTGAPRRHVGETVQGAARLRLDRAVSRRTTLGIGLGAAASSFTVAPNPVYTGDRYLSTEIAAVLHWRALPEMLAVEVEGAVQPVVASDHADGAHGPARGFGARADTAAHWTPLGTAPNPMLRRLRVTLRYRFQRFRSQFPNSPLDRRGAVGREDRHFTTLSIGYTVD